MPKLNLCVKLVDDHGVSCYEGDCLMVETDETFGPERAVITAINTNFVTVRFDPLSSLSSSVRALQVSDFISCTKC